jgi:hypothetical protein
MVLGIYVFCLALGGVLIVASIALGGHGHDGAEHHIEIGHADHDLGQGDHDLGQGDHDLGQGDHDLGQGDHDLGQGDHDVGHADHDVGHADHDVAHAGQGALQTGHSAGPVIAAAGSWSDSLLVFLSIRFWTFLLAALGLTGLLLDLLGFPAAVSAPVAAVTGLGCGFGVTRIFDYLRRSTMGTTVSVRGLAGSEGVVVLQVRPGKLGKVRISMEGPDIDLPAITRDEGTLAIQTRVLVVAVRDGVAEVTSVPGLIGQRVADPENDDTSTIPRP